MASKMIRLADLIKDEAVAVAGGEGHSEETTLVFFEAMQDGEILSVQIEMSNARARELGIIDDNGTVICED